MRGHFFPALIACLLPMSVAYATPPVGGPVCAAKVIHSEEVPFAPQGFWLARVTLHVVPRTGRDFVTTIEQTIPWQKSAPRYGEIYLLRCDPAEFQLFSGGPLNLFESQQRTASVAARPAAYQNALARLLQYARP